MRYVSGEGESQKGRATNVDQVGLTGKNYTIESWGYFVRIGSCLSGATAVSLIQSSALPSISLEEAIRRLSMSVWIYLKPNLYAFVGGWV